MADIVVCDKNLNEVYTKRPGERILLYQLNRKRYPRECSLSREMKQKLNILGEKLIYLCLRAARKNSEARGSRLML